MDFAFICGCGHSGTSLILAVLGAHSKVHAISYETGAMLPWSKAAVLDQLRQTADQLPLEKEVLVEKTAGHIQYLDKVRAAFPGCRLVIPVRNPLDVVASLKLRGWRDLAKSIGRRLGDNTVVVAQRQCPDVFVYKHEDLCREPMAVLPRICGHLKLSFESAQLEFHRQDVNWLRQTEVVYRDGIGEADHKLRRNWQLHQPLYNSEGRWRGILSDEEARLVVESTGDMAKILGYPDLEKSLSGG